MKNLFVCLAVAAGVFAAPAVSFAQSSDPVTRAEVRADLVRVEQAGYNPALASDPYYPQDIQAAEAKIAKQDDQGKQSYGGVADTSSASGKPARVAMKSACVGPASFCNPYFGS